MKESLSSRGEPAILKVFNIIEDWRGLMCQKITSVKFNMRDFKEINIKLPIT